MRVLSALQADVGQREALGRIRYWGERFGLANISGGWVGRNELQLNFTDPETGTPLPIAAAGGGSQHVLPFLLNCFSSPAPRILIADELEQGLHPKWQLTLAELLAEAVARKNQVILCTQSPTLVLGLCSMVAQQKLAPESVVVYSMKRGESGAAEAAANQISSSGVISGGWFEHFAELR